jgi:hypothetical protein
MREKFRQQPKKPKLAASCDEDGLCKAFYLQPMANRRVGKKEGPVTYKDEFSNGPMGEHKISDMLKEIQRLAGIDDVERTNHALRRTCILLAKRGGMSEQEIVRRSRHKDLESLRSYMGYVLSCFVARVLCYWCPAVPNNLSSAIRQPYCNVYCSVCFVLFECSPDFCHRYCNYTRC